LSFRGLGFCENEKCVAKVCSKLVFLKSVVILQSGNERFLNVSSIKRNDFYWNVELVGILKIRF